MLHSGKIVVYLISTCDNQHTFITDFSAITHRIGQCTRSVKADKRENGERAPKSQCVEHVSWFEQLGLKVTWLTGTMEHQSPNEKQRLWRQANQAIYSGQATQQNVAGFLKARCFDHCNDDDEIADERKNTKRYVNSNGKNIVYIGCTVVGGKGDPGRQSAYSGSVALIIGHSLVTMVTYARTGLI